MTNVPAKSFVKKSTAEELLPRSGRQLTRDISKAVACRDFDSLKCFQLRLLDQSVIEGVDIEDTGIVKQLGLDGRGPEWYVDVDSLRTILDRRATTRTRPSHSRYSEKSAELEPVLEETAAETVPPKTEENTLHGNYLDELLKEKDFRIKELKDSKDYLEQLLEKLIGKDTLKALAEIVGNEGVNSSQLVSLVKTTTANSKHPSSDSVASENEVVKEAEEETFGAKKPREKTEPVVIDVVSSEADATTSQNAKLVNKTKKKTAKKIRQPVSKKSATRSKNSKQSKPKKKQPPKWNELPTLKRFFSSKK